MPEFLLPDLGEGLREAEVVSWLVKVGDTVEIDQVVVEVETAKAAVEVPVPFAGVVAVLHAQEGEMLPVGKPLITVTEVGSVNGAGFREPGTVVPETSDLGDDDARDQGSGNVLIGYGTPPPSARRRRGRRMAKGSVLAPPVEVSNAIAVSSPLVRKLARDAALDLRDVAGTGPDGRITRSDVEQAMAASPRTLAAASSPGNDIAVPNTGNNIAVPNAGHNAAAPRTVNNAAVPNPVNNAVVPNTVGSRVATAVGSGANDSVQRIPLKGLRKVVADKLSRSRREIPEATVWVDVDATAMLATRLDLNTADPQRPVSLLALLARFAVAGLRRYPELNGRVEDDEIVLTTAVHLGFAAQTERGLMVPVVHNAHLLTTRELAAAMSERTRSARASSLAPADLTGGTFTVNNYGVFGVDGSAAIINHPEVAILGIGRIIDKPWVHQGQVAIRKMTQLTLAFDHRVCDGATAGGFLRLVADCVESPAVALGEL